jgi:hypothetical protein
MTAPRHRLPAGRTAPSGVMRDAVTVEGIITPADALLAGGAPQGGDGVMPSVPPAAHRRSWAGKREQDGDLVTSDFELQYPTAELRGPPIAPVTWTPDDGFIEEPQPEPATPMTMFRRRTPTHPGEVVESHEDELLDGGDDHDHDHPAVRFVPAEGPRRVAPPRDLVDLVEQVTGVHVGDTVIDRSPQVTERATELGAIAFTEGGTVHLPAELGDIDDPDVRGVTAHELVHVAQHRASQGGLPHEDSSEGMRLEAEARAVQRALGPGAPVVPAFIRSSLNLPAHRAVGPVGVQRLANEASGIDFTDVDLSDVQPGSLDDPFFWQEREGEPTGGPWEQRRAWDERFETEHSNTLQRKRDERFSELIRGAEAGGLDPESVVEARRRLDVEMPYQFGAPPGIDPYPGALPAEGSAALGRTVPTGGGGGGVAAVTAGAVGARALAAVPAVQSTAAETREAREALTHITSRAHEAYREQGDPQGSLVDRFEERLALERDLRWEVLSAKREAAESEHAEADHVVSLSEEEVARIREAVDVQLPLHGGRLSYVEGDHQTMSVAGALDVALPSGSRARPQSQARTAPGGAGATGAAAGGAGAGASDTPEHGDAEAQSRLQALLNQARGSAGADDDGSFTVYQLADRYEVRFEYERVLRRSVLEAKVQGAVQAGDQIGTTVTIDQAELQQIHEAVDIAHPLAIAEPHYLASDEFMSREIAYADIARWGGAAAGQATTAATDAATTTPVTGAADAGPPVPATSAAADTTTAPAADGTAATQPGVSVGAVALATGVGRLIQSMTNDDPHAGDELSGAVVDSLTEVDLEILTRRLWGRVRRELRTELLIDRERAGALADIR